MSFYFGVDYYPEHWPQDRWETDAVLMEQLGIQVVRMGEFSWTKMEPKEGEYHFEWLDQAIHGLKTLQPFCVKGFLEPMRMICVVSYWNCHILVEDDDRDPLNPEEVLHEISHTSMLEFCRQLRDDIRANLEQWVRFVDYHEEDLEEKRLRLEQKLAELDTLIAAREESFDEWHCFL